MQYTCWSVVWVASAVGLDWSFLRGWNDRSLVALKDFTMEGMRFHGFRHHNCRHTAGWIRE